MKSEWLRKCEAKMNEMRNMLEDDTLRPEVRAKYKHLLIYWEDETQAEINNLINIERQSKKYPGSDEPCWN